MKSLLMIGILLLSSLPYGQSFAAKKGSSFGLNIENDTQKIGGPNSDDGYTNGAKFTYQFAQEKAPNWAPTLRDLANQFYETPVETTNFSLALAHKMYTPRDYSTTKFQADERPYAAWLYLSTSISTKTDHRSDTLEFSLGTIGPYAMGENVQNNFHDLIGEPRAYGWKHQLYNEPTVQLNYTTKRRFVDYFTDKKRMFDIIPLAGVSVGNVLIGANLGILGRIGYNLPSDFGPTRASSTDGEMIQEPREKFSDKWRVYLFASFRGKGIVRDIFLDGNTAGGSHRVSKKPFVAETELGYGIHYSRFSFVWRFVTLSPEFKEQSYYQSFASININYFADIE